MLDISALVKEWFGNHKKIQIQDTVIKLEEAEKTKKKQYQGAAQKKLLSSRIRNSFQKESLKIALLLGQNHVHYLHHGTSMLTHRTMKNYGFSSDGLLKSLVILLGDRDKYQKKLSIIEDVADKVYLQET